MNDKPKPTLHVDAALSGPPRRPDPSGSAARRPLSLDEYAVGIQAGDRAVLGRAITLVESQRPEHQQLAQALLERLLPRTGNAIRVGITGVPGAGKSTFIEALGCHLVAAGGRVAVLAVDPSSGVSGGSILGDKTRMARLAASPQAFIRPSPSAGRLGGVAQKTRESMLLCEAAGYDVILVETVGVGQSETVVAGMTDIFLALLLAGAGDELQGIKRGILELVDVLAVNKADQDNQQRAAAAAREIATALHIVHGGSGREVPVLTCSAAENTGVEEVWRAVTDLHARRVESGDLQRRRREQSLRWMHALLEEGLLRFFRQNAELRQRLEELEVEVSAGARAPYAAVRELLDRFAGDARSDEL
jgi:LAO/AO transport system kinase